MSTECANRPALHPSPSSWLVPRGWSDARTRSWKPPSSLAVEWFAFQEAHPPLAPSTPVHPCPAPSAQLYGDLAAACVYYCRASINSPLMGRCVIDSREGVAISFWLELAGEMTDGDYRADVSLMIRASSGMLHQFKTNLFLYERERERVSKIHVLQEISSFRWLSIPKYWYIYVYIES